LEEKNRIITNLIFITLTIGLASILNIKTFAQSNPVESNDLIILDILDKPGFFSPIQKTWYLKHDHNDGWNNYTTVRFGAGASNWEPVAGDWDNDSVGTIGFFSPDQKTWYLKNTQTDGWNNCLGSA